METTQLLAIINDIKENEQMHQEEKERLQRMIKDLVEDVEALTEELIEVENKYEWAEEYNEHVLKKANDNQDIIEHMTEMIDDLIEENEILRDKNETLDEMVRRGMEDYFEIKQLLDALLDKQEEVWIFEINEGNGNH